MNLDQFIAQEKGKKHLIPGQSEVYRGQCVQLIGIYLETFGIELPVHPNAKDYWTYGIPGFDRVSAPEPGDIAVYDGHGAFPEGHIAICANNGWVFEENADPDDSPAHLASRSNTYLLGYLRKGEDMGRIEDLEQLANDRQEALVKVAKTVSVDYKDFNDLPQVIANIKNEQSRIDQLTEIVSKSDMASDEKLEAIKKIVNG